MGFKTLPRLHSSGIRKRMGQSKVSKGVFPSLAKGVGLVFIVILVALSLPRFFKFSSLCPRSYECAALYRTIQGPFRSDFSHHKDQICGDLASMANRPDLCVYRPETFITDPWGYRNTHEVWERSNEVLLLGDSFALGQGVTQKLTPAVQLTELLGKNVYGGGGRFELDYIRWLLDHLKEKPRMAVFLHLERHHHKSRELKDWNKPLNENNPFKKIQIIWESFWNYNPLKVIVANLDKKYVTPGIFPNRYGQNIPIFRLRNGRDFLFLKSSVDQYGDPHDHNLESEAEYFEGFNKIFVERGIKLLFVLVPEKYSVYAHLIENPATPVLLGSAYLDDLQQELSKRHVSSINLLPILKAQAAKLFEHSEYVYWPDDTHWNSTGIHIAAEEISRQILKASP